MDLNPGPPATDKGYIWGNMRLGRVKAGVCQQDLSLGPHHVLLWCEPRVRSTEVCGLWRGVLLSKGHALVGGELPPLLGFTQDASPSGESSCPTM